VRENLVRSRGYCLRVSLVRLTTTPPP